MRLKSASRLRPSDDRDDAGELHADGREMLVPVKGKGKIEGTTYGRERPVDGGKL